MEVDRPVSMEACVRPRRHRHEPQRAFSGANLNQKTLELEGIVSVLKQYHDYEGGINCSICGEFGQVIPLFIDSLIVQYVE